MCYTAHCDRQHLAESAKCARSNVAAQRKEYFEKTKAGCGTRKGAEIAANLFRITLEKPSPKTHVLLKLDFKNASNLNREIMLKHMNAVGLLLFQHTSSLFPDLGQ